MNAIQYLGQGWRLMWQPGTRRYVIVPILLNVVLLILLSWAGIHYFQQFLTWMDQSLPSWLHWLNILLWVLYVATYLIVSAYVFTWFGNVVGAPFYSLLAAHIQKQHSNIPLPDSAWHDIATQFPNAIARQLRILGYMLPRIVGILILSLIPGLNLLATVLWYLFGSWCQSLQYLDYPCDNNGQSFAELKLWLQSDWRSNLSFGAVLMLFMMIPIVNVVVMPMAVCAATLMWIDRHNKSF